LQEVGDLIIVCNMIIVYGILAEIKRSFNGKLKVEIGKEGCAFQIIQCCYSSLLGIMVI